MIGANCHSTQLAPCNCLFAQKGRILLLCRASVKCHSSAAISGTLAVKAWCAFPPRTLTSQSASSISFRCCVLWWQAGTDVSVCPLIITNCYPTVSWLRIVSARSEAVSQFLFFFFFFAQTGIRSMAPLHVRACRRGHVASNSVHLPPTSITVPRLLRTHERAH